MKRIVLFFLIVLSLPAFSQLSVTNETGCPVDILLNGKQMAFIQATDALKRPTTMSVNIPCSASGFDARYLDNGNVKTAAIKKDVGSCSVILAKDNNGIVYNKLFTASYGSPVSSSSISGGQSSAPNFTAYVGFINKSKDYIWVEKSAQNGPFAGVCLKPMDTCKSLVSRDATGKPLFKVYKAEWDQGYHQMSMRFSATADIRDAQPQTTLSRYVAQGDEFITVLDSDFPESTLGGGTPSKETKARFIIENWTSVKLIGGNGVIKGIVFDPGTTFDKSMITKTGKQDWSFDFVDENNLARTVTMNAVMSKGRIKIVINKDDLKNNFFHK